jgi:hypothetical protein
MTVNAANFYSAAQGERAAVAQRTADVRKKLFKSAAGIDSAATPEETLLIGQWMDARPSQMQSEEQYHASLEGRDSDFD